MQKFWWLRYFKLSILADIYFLEVLIHKLARHSQHLSLVAEKGFDTHRALSSVCGMNLSVFSSRMSTFYFSTHHFAPSLLIELYTNIYILSSISNS